MLRKVSINESETGKILAPIIKKGNLSFLSYVNRTLSPKHGKDYTQRRFGNFGLRLESYSDFLEFSNIMRRIGFRT